MKDSEIKIKIITLQTMLPCAAMIYSFVDLGSSCWIFFLDLVQRALETDNWVDFVEAKEKCMWVTSGLGH